MSLYFNKLLFLLIALIASAAGPSIAADSLAVSPSRPTTSDSIGLSIFPQNQDCCFHYVYNPTDVALQSDSTIMLSYRVTIQFVDTLCCIPGTIPVLNYKSKPLSAGNYYVYAQSLPQPCLDTNCPQLIPARPALIGKFKVSLPNATLFRNKSMPLEDIGKLSGVTRVYDIRGAIVPSNRIGALKRNSGVYFVKPEGRSVAKMKIWY